jgi:hypothetical protein
MTNKPKNSAACRWRSGHAGAVKENTAGAETITDNPWGNVRTTAGDPQIYISAELFFFLKPRKFESMILSDII